MRDHIHFPARACLVLIQGPRVSSGVNSRSIIPPAHPPRVTFVEIRPRRVKRGGNEAQVRRRA